MIIWNGTVRFSNISNFAVRLYERTQFEKSSDHQVPPRKSADIRKPSLAKRGATCGMYCMFQHTSHICQ